MSNALLAHQCATQRGQHKKKDQTNEGLILLLSLWRARSLVRSQKLRSGISRHNSASVDVKCVVTGRVPALA